MPSASAVTAVRTALGDVFRPVEMGRAGTSVTACAEQAYEIYEVTFCHSSREFTHKAINLQIIAYICPVTNLT